MVSALTKKKAQEEEAARPKEARAETRPARLYCRRYVAATSREMTAKPGIAEKSELAARKALARLKK